MASPWVVTFAVLMSAVRLGRVVGTRAGPARGTLVIIGGEVESGKVTPAIDRTYPLSDAADAIRLPTSGQVSGKVVITLADKRQGWGPSDALG
jgi:NADPH:quinone reductase-like Zn-dependent oxidoreductase